MLAALLHHVYCLSCCTLFFAFSLFTAPRLFGAMRSLSLLRSHGRYIFLRHLCSGMLCAFNNLQNSLSVRRVSAGYSSFSRKEEERKGRR
jgi:hypothetical protein